MNNSFKQYEPYVNKNLNLTKVQFAYTAGIVEGEGTMGIDNRSKTRYKNSTAPGNPYLKISMTDKDVIVNIANSFQRKNFQAKRKTVGGKTEHIISISSRSDLMYILPGILPFLGNRRTTECQKCLDSLDEWVKWYEARGRSKSAVQGGKATAAKKQTKIENKKLEEIEKEIEEET